MTNLHDITTYSDSDYPLHIGIPSLQEAGIGMMLASAMPVLLLMIKLKNTFQKPNVEELNKHAITEIKTFVAKVQQLNYDHRTCTAACYCLCTAFDEAILGTPWGGNSSWVQNPLLSAIHKETWGGERFYAILNKMAEDPATNLDILELLYMLLSLGFEGKYFESHKNSRDEIRYTLFNLIRNYRESPSKILSPAAIDKRVASYHAQRIIPRKYIGLMCVAVLVITMGIFNYKSYKAATPLLNSLNRVSYLSQNNGNYNYENAKY